ncbi:hypothetical protein [Bacteroides sp.]|uniref:hypothetical protein n=1 Tax=Bacteroides sp. TaxID=29523 RepID=UPI003AAFC31B
MKTYVITLSQVFPTGHKRAGEPTSFRDAFNAGQVFNRGSLCLYRHPKKHTIRSNYPLWLKRITEVQQGKAVLSVRQWTGKPYRSKQEEIASLTASDGIGIQMLSFAPLYTLAAPFVNGRRIATNTLASNDGLRDADWREWFMHYDLTQPMAIIHFTKFRY